MEVAGRVALLLSVACLILAKPYSAGALLTWKNAQSFENFLTAYNCSPYNGTDAFLCKIDNFTLLLRDGYIQANAPCTTESSGVLEILKAPKKINCSIFDSCIQSNGKTYLRGVLNSGEIELFLENNSIKDFKVRADLKEAAEFLKAVGFKVKLYSCKEVPVAALNAEEWLKNFLRKLKEGGYLQGYSLTRPRYNLCNITPTKNKPENFQEKAEKIAGPWLLVAVLPVTALMYFTYMQLTNFRGRRRYRF